MSTISNYFNPCSNEFNSINDFKTLSTGQRFKVVIFTALTILSLCVLTIPVFRLLVGRFTKLNANQLPLSADKTQRIAQLHIQPVQSPKKSHIETSVFTIPNNDPLAYLHSFYPIRVTDEEMNVQAQKQRYENALKSCENLGDPWIPLPNNKNEKWTEEQIKEHLKAGYPIYLRILHPEDEFASFDNMAEAILPSRINTTSTYNPREVLETIYDWRNKWLPFAVSSKAKSTQEIQRNVAEIQRTQNISECQAYIQYVVELHKKSDNTFDLKECKNLIIEHLLSLHASDGSSRTPFKGMIGMTLTDKDSLEEFRNLVSAFKKGKKIIIALDRYGRFMHNSTNSHQKKEFVALGGILRSEIVFELEPKDFAQFIEKMIS